MKKQIRILLVGVLVGLMSSVCAQEKKQKDLDWYNCSFEMDSVYGAEVNKAYDFLKGKEVKKTPVVAVIGLGLDIDHEDLIDAIWENPNPMRGDMNGWNFIGGRDGEMLVNTPTVADREFERLKDKYANLMFCGGKFWYIENEQVVEYTGEVNREEYEWYDWVRQTGTSEVMQAYASLIVSYFMRDFVARVDSDMRAKFPDRELTRADFIEIIKEPGYRKHRLDSASAYFSEVRMAAAKRDDWKYITDDILSGNDIQRAKEKCRQVESRLDLGIRKRVVGDDFRDLNDTNYGNNTLFTSACIGEVMRAGIIAAKRGNGLGGDGIADFARLMPLVAYPEKGEPYAKDIVLAVRYAVDHGANIIVLAYQPRVTTPQARQWYEDAMRYAESKDVLVVIPAWEWGERMEKGEYAPNRFTKTGELSNIIVVSPSDKKGNPSLNSNFSPVEVDIYAPGMDIYASTPGDMYQMGTGTILCAGTVAGVAALIRGYYPHLRAGQVRTLLMENVTTRDGVEVEKGVALPGRKIQDLYLFEELCGAKGIINAFKAVVAADKIK